MGKYALFCQYFSLLMYYSLFILSCLSSHFDASIYILLISSSILLIAMVSDVFGVVCLVFVHGCSMSICSICYFVHVSMICSVVFKINYVGSISSYFFYLSVHYIHQLLASHNKNDPTAYPNTQYYLK